MAIEFPHPRDRLRHIANRALDDLEITPAALAQTLFRFQQGLGVERDGRDCIIDVVRDAACHLAKRKQPLLLHHGVVGLAQIFISLLQGAVKLRVMGGEGGVLGQLVQELAIIAGEALGPFSRRDENAEHSSSVRMTTWKML